MKFVIRYLFITLTLQANAQTIMRFKADITTHAQYLGDLILISNEHHDWMKIPLDSQPKAGEEIIKDQVIDWLINKKGTFKYLWKGINKTRVKQLTLSSGSDLVNKAQGALAIHLKRTYESISLHSTSIVKDSEFTLSDFQVKIPQSAPPSRLICVRLNRNKHSIPIWFKVKAYQKVLVAKHSIKNRSIIKETDFTLQKRNVAGLKNQPITQLPQAHWLKHSINQGHILIQDDLALVPQVLRGETTQVVLSSHGISVVTKAIALKDGYIGQSVPFKNPETNKNFFARVSGSYQAEISS